MAEHSGKTITFGTDLLPLDDDTYFLGNENKKWKIYGDVTGTISGYLPLSGGTMTGPLTWKNSTALPEKTNADYFLAIDAFTDGGKTYWVSKANVLSSIGAAAAVTGGYLPKSGGTMTGALNFANNTWNLVGDDAYLGDINKAGHIGIQGKNGNTGLFFTTYNQTTKTTGGAITWDGTKFSITSTTAVDASISGNAATASAVRGTEINSETEMTTTGLALYSGSGGNWTGSIDSMAYAGILQVGNSYTRGWQVWARRGTNYSLHWRNPKDDQSGWETARIILDTGNTTIPSTVPTLSWGAEATVLTINNSAVKIKAMAKPTYTASDVGAATANHNHDGVYAPVSHGTHVTTDSVKSALNISSNGSATKWLNEQGSWTTPTAADVGALSDDTVVTNVAFTSAIDNNEYPILIKNSTGSTTTAASAKFPNASGKPVTINPSTGTITATTFSGNATTASKITNITSTDVASDTATWRRVWISYNDNVFGRPAYKDTIAFQASTNTLKSGKYLVGDHVTLEYNSTDDSLDFVFV